MKATMRPDVKPPRLTPNQFAQAIGRTRRFVMRLIAAGEIQAEDVRGPGSKLPRWEIDPAQAEAWRRSRRRLPRRGLTATAPPATSTPKQWPDVTETFT